jgi:hypothetical protein
LRTRTQSSRSNAFPESSRCGPNTGVPPQQAHGGIQGQPCGGFMVSKKNMPAAPPPTGVAGAERLSRAVQRTWRRRPVAGHTPVGLAVVWGARRRWLGCWARRRRGSRRPAIGRLSWVGVAGRGGGAEFAIGWGLRGEAAACFFWGCAACRLRFAHEAETEDANLWCLL